MGCGCKNKKKKADLLSNVNQPNTQEQILDRKKIVQNQQNYQSKVKDALKQLMDIRKRKQNLRS
tara:strand:- start:202 stop:393 length:192 start_codon:yes stop_codon:yes gene_type:complete